MKLPALTAGLKMSISWCAQFRSPVKITGFDFSSSCMTEAPMPGSTTPVWQYLIFEALAVAIG